MIYQVIHSQQEEEDIASLEDDDDAVEVEELCTGEEDTPQQGVSLIRIRSFPLVTPGGAKKTLGHPHVGQEQVTGTKHVHVHQCYEDTEEARNPLPIDSCFMG